MTASILKVSFLCLVIVFVGICELQIHNTLHYPLRRGFDAVAHLDYISYLQSNKHLPLPVEGWEMFQPPLYYVLASLLPSFISPKWIGFISWLGLGLILGSTLKGFIKNQPWNKELRANHQRLAAILATCITLATPVVLTLSAAISNEFFATVLISAGLWVYTTRFLPSLAKSSLPKAPLFVATKAAAWLGVWLGLALLSKATGMVLVMAILLERLIVLKGNLRVTFRQLAVPFVIAGLIGGWFYIRSFNLYGNPFYQPADYIPLRNYAQPIVARDLKFFFSPTAFITQDFFVAQNSSFLAGTFFSWFYDGHGSLLPPQPYTKAGALVIGLGAVFLGIAVVGFLSPWVIAYRQRVFRPDQYFIFYIYGALLLGAYIQYNFKLPIYSTVKGAFISSLILPFGFFLLKGIMEVVRPLTPKWRPRFLSVLTLLAVVYLGVITRHFWFQEWWYVVP